MHADQGLCIISVTLETFCEVNSRKTKNDLLCFCMDLLF